MQGRIVLEPGSDFAGFRVLWPLSPEIDEEPGARTHMVLDETTGERAVLQVARGDPSQLEEFQGWLRRCRGVVIPFMPALLTGGVKEDLAWVVHAWVPGMSLATMLRTTNLGPEVAVGLLWMWASALSRLHARKFVHGDIHPRNLRITVDGQALLVGHFPQPFARPLTTCPPGIVMPRYGAPEFNHDGTLSAASDVYSLGLVIYELLASRPLLPATDADDALQFQRRVQDAFGRIQRVARRIPKALDGLLRGMLQLDPAKRLQDGPALVQAILASCPKAADLKWIGRAMGSIFARARDQALRTGLDGVDTDVEAGRPIEAAAGLRTLLDLDPENHGLRQVRTSLTEVAWMGLIRVPPPCFWHLVVEAALRVEDRALAAESHQRSLLGGIQEEIPDPAELPPKNARISRAVERLELRPLDSRALLELAFADIGGRRGSETPAAWKARLLLYHGFPEQAVYCRARDLLERPDLSLVDELEGLLLRLRKDLSSGIVISGPRKKDDGSEPTIDELLDELTLAFGEDTGEDMTRPPPMSFVPREADPGALFDEGCRQLVKEDLSEASRVFQELLALDAGSRREYHAPVCQQLRGLMWRALALRGQASVAFEMLRDTHRMAADLGLEDLLPLCESLLLAAVPKDGRSETLSELVALAPTSIRFRQAAAVDALERDDPDSWSEHLLAAARQFVERKDLLSSSKLIMAARTVCSSPELAEVSAASFRLAEELGLAAEAFREVEGLGDDASSAERLASCESFLERFPGYQPAEELAVELAAGAEVPIQVTQGLTQLARNAILREDFQTARRYLCFVLESEVEAEEALLYLAALEPPSLASARKGPVCMRLEVLRREGLLEAAKHHARSALHGDEGDAWLHQILLQLCRETGEDHGPHLFALAGFAAAEGREEEAATHANEYLSSGGDAELLAALLKEFPGLQERIAITP